MDAQGCTVWIYDFNLLLLDIGVNQSSGTEKPKVHDHSSWKQQFYSRLWPPILLVFLCFPVQALRVRVGGIKIDGFMTKDAWSLNQFSLQHKKNTAGVGETPRRISLRGSDNSFSGCRKTLWTLAYVHKGHAKRGEFFYLQGKIHHSWNSNSRPMGSDANEPG